MTKAGIVTVAGAPNAGKSTLLNRIIGEKLAITSRKPQSTRDRIVGIRTDDSVQMIVFDTPGLFEPRYQLQRTMRAAALRALDDADVIVYVADATLGPPPPLAQAAGLPNEPRAPVIVALNKLDLIDRSKRAQLAKELPESILISAKQGDNVDRLIETATKQLPESPFLYPPDEISTQSVRFFVAELVRETVLDQLHDELPYSVACAVEEFREDRNPLYIRAVIYVERESQKRIIIGAGGSRIKDLGRASRAKIEALVDKPVYLDLWVKVAPNWRKSTSALERFGYHLTRDNPR
ncbi:MAG TPA: GTPase Era [Gemmatimonadaceae bacterium]|jgi:GTP-binding protein Era